MTARHAVTTDVSTPLTCTVDQRDGTRLGTGLLHCMQVAPDDWVLVLEMDPDSLLSRPNGGDAALEVLVRAASGPLRTALIERVGPQAALHRLYTLRLTTPSAPLAPVGSLSQEGVPAMPKQAPDASLTVAEIAMRLRVDAEEVRDWLQTGQLHGTRVGTDWRITEADLEGFLQRLRSQTPVA
ncbi:MAG: helix-turn-helix domain-containing protein [Dehalococcoidia bacterium]